MPDLSILATPAPYHILTYGTLLGTTFFQTFIGGVTAYRALPRPQFSALQKSIFPIYFSIQTALPLLMAMTFPGAGSGAGGVAGVLAAENRWGVGVPTTALLATGLMNWVWAGPKTTAIMARRKRQEVTDGRKSYDDPAGHSDEMRALNAAFGRAHGASSLLNLVGFVAMLWYGIELSKRIQ